MSKPKQLVKNISEMNCDIAHKSRYLNTERRDHCRKTDRDIPTVLKVTADPACRIVV